MDHLQCKDIPFEIELPDFDDDIVSAIITLLEIVTNHYKLLNEAFEAAIWTYIIAHSCANYENPRDLIYLGDGAVARLIGIGYGLIKKTRQSILSMSYIMEVYRLANEFLLKEDNAEAIDSI